jgi:hypothetical protein
MVKWRERDAGGRKKVKEKKSHLEIFYLATNVESVQEGVSLKRAQKAEEHYSNLFTVAGGHDDKT